ncbi:MAG: hypothetical protein KA533_07025 [Sphingobium sp.]|nr:hypothetical protein [Sphingobium sp.]MBP6111687.1 hypothetical protein [Sphingobium sp.]MBP8671946.1 hypothetical protein [Sphingobium sp.]MBP9157787.1 hypothetical protein [Sphingobium sp.]MCC6481649.1 hypothetical protein [Sphingomonadaceae bacterium]
MAVVIETIGWSSAVLILAGYVANSSGWLDRRSWLYQLVNLVGASGFIVYTGMHHTWATMTLNGIWAAVAAWALLRILRGRMRARSA